MKKSFKEMSQEEIQKMSKEEFLAVSPFEKQSCYDCAFIKEALSLWCGNKEAIKYRGTSFPGCVKCHFWKPDWKYIDKKYRTAENGYVEPAVVSVPKSWFKKIVDSIKKIC